MRRSMRKDPLGVTATPQMPSSQYFFPFPVETGRIRSSTPSFQKNSTWRLKSTSMRVGPPSGSSGVGSVAAAMAARTSTVARPLRGIPATFWKAITAEVSPPP